jgi:hypothetical protein
MERSRLSFGSTVKQFDTQFMVLLDRFFRITDKDVEIFGIWLLIAKHAKIKLNTTRQLQV